MLKERRGWEFSEGCFYHKENPGVATDEAGEPVLLYCGMERDQVGGVEESVCTESS